MDQIQNCMCEWSSLTIGIYGGQIFLHHRVYFYSREVHGSRGFLQIILQACIFKKMPLLNIQMITPSWQCS